MKKLNPVQGLKKIFSLHNLIELLKSGFKISFLGLLLYLVIRQSVDPLLKIPYMGLPGVRFILAEVLKKMVLYTSAAFLIVAAVDYYLQQFQQEFVPSVAATLTTARLEPNHSRFDPFVIYLDQKMIGFLTCSIYPDDPACCYLGGFIIAAGFQGRGLGKRSLKQLLRTLPQVYPGCSRVRLNAHPANKIAVRLYRGLGFRLAPDRTQRYLNFVLDLARRDGKRVGPPPAHHLFIAMNQPPDPRPKGV